MTLDLKQTTASRDELNREIAERKQAQEELVRSNKDLEQFAYVASHDLQEPLRAVAGFVELLRRNLEKSLDEKTSEYMNFSIEAPNECSRLSTVCSNIRASALRVKNPEGRLQSGLRRGISASSGEHTGIGAKITADDLPVVYFDDLQLSRLFQNLIGNAIKFRGDQAPQIHVSAVRQDAGWRFAVRDNGIGIEPQYAERIFMIFQRLHTRKTYAGTGMGSQSARKLSNGTGEEYGLNPRQDAVPRFILLFLI